MTEKQARIEGPETGLAGWEEARGSSSSSLRFRWASLVHQESPVSFLALFCGTGEAKFTLEEGHGLA